MRDNQMIVQVRYPGGAAFSYHVAECDVDSYVSEATALGAHVAVAQALPTRRLPEPGQPLGAA